MTTSIPAQTGEKPTLPKLARIAGLILLASSVPLLSFCSSSGLGKKPGKLTVPVASYGIDTLKSSYAKALETGDIDGLRTLYSGVDFSAPGKWELPLVSSGQGVEVRHTDAAQLPAPQLSAFLSSMSSKLGKRDRAQVWFRKLDMNGDLAAHVELWAEASGSSAGRRHSYRGVWHWDVARTSTSAPWKILRHALSDWSEASSKRLLFEEVSSRIGVNMQQDFKEDNSSPFMAGIQGANIGSGVTLIDVEGDGDLDIHLVNGIENRLFLNGGSGYYREVSSVAGTDHPGLGHSALVVDFTGDGLKDIYIVNTRQPNVLLINHGGQRFKEAPDAGGAAGDLVTDTSACAADVDLDGDLDLVVAGYLKPLVEWKNDSGSLTNGAANRLYINDGAGHFVDETSARGLAKEKGLSLVCSFGDFDNDGDPDLMVGNDLMRDHLYVNDGHGHFREEGRQRGLKDRGFSMSASWCDVDNDGDLDIHISKMTSGTSWMFDDRRFPVTGLQRMIRPLVIRELKKSTAGNSLFINQGDGTFRDVAKEVGLDVAHWAFSAVPIDFDLDGDLDFYTCNGFITGESAEDT